MPLTCELISACPELRATACLAPATGAPRFLTAPATPAPIRLKASIGPSVITSLIFIIAKSPYATYEFIGVLATNTVDEPAF